MVAFRWHGRQGKLRGARSSQGKADAQTPQEIGGNSTQSRNFQHARMPACDDYQVLGVPSLRIYAFDLTALFVFV